MSNGDINSLLTIAWPEARLDDAFAALSDKFYFFQATRKSHSHEHTGHNLQSKIESLADTTGVEAQKIFSTYDEIEETLRTMAPGLVRVTHNQQTRLLVITGCRRNQLEILTPTLKCKHIPIKNVVAALRLPLEAKQQSTVEKVVHTTGISEANKARVTNSLLKQILAGEPITGLWYLRPLVNASVSTQTKYFGLHTSLISLFLSYGLYYFVWLASWAIIGFGTLSGRMDAGWMAAWILSLLTLIPLRMWFIWSQAKFSIGFGAVLKRSLLAGAMHMDTDQLKQQGLGQLLGRVFESSEFEALALSGGLFAVVATIELLMASVVMLNGAQGPLLFLLLIIWLAISAVCFYSVFKKIRAWTHDRIHLTNELIENMVGHRTRLAQEPSSQRHSQEDWSLKQYWDSAKAMDRTTLWVTALPRGWLVLGVLGLSLGLVYSNFDTVSLAISAGAIILCYRAISSLSQGFRDIAKALIAWQNLTPLLEANRNAETVTTAHPHPPQKESQQLITARELNFKYPSSQRPAINNCSFNIAPGSRILLQGGSGSGKSTLASILSGLRPTDSGLLMLNGRDMATLGAISWRKRVILASQFHDNHIFMAPFAFNLLMGRNWPPTYEDLELAEKICRGLGLDDLLAKMPGGMMQLVGDTGWQLSHGEKSRVYVARALLQEADLLILDESFSALDPENTGRALECVQQTSGALIVIAHP